MPLPSLRTLTDAEFVQHVRVACKMFAVKSFEKDHPNCGKEAAWQYAQQHWKNFQEVALDWLSMCEAMAEADAAPWN